MKGRLSEYLKPPLVLTLLCVVSAAALGLVNGATAPVIAERRAAEALAARQAFFPDAADFIVTECSLDGVSEVCRADTGGYVITVETGGYNGPVAVTVGISQDGEVIGVNADTSGETANKGTLASEPEYTSLFVGLTGSADGVEVISGATISSRAVRSGVTLALEAYRAVTEGQG